jgi:hypothetical protein
MRAAQRGRAMIQDSDVTGFGRSGIAAPPLAAPPRGNEGVGEHVRTDFTMATSAGEIAEKDIRTERRNLFSSAGPVFD